MDEKLTYASSGVDIEAGTEAVDRIRPLVRKTFRPGVLGDVGGFGGLFAPDFAGMTEPVLVSSTDGVGTKLKVAFMMDRHDTVGIDLVAMCANDVVVQGAEPLFFLDYIGTGRLMPGVVEQIVRGISEGCIDAGCALIGGEMAEMPTFYADGEYDLAGFVVGIVDRSRIIDGNGIRAGNRLIGLPSKGLHSNGFSLVRKLFFDRLGLSVGDRVDGLEANLGQEILRPTRIYVRPVLEILKRHEILGMAHITGGGLTDNVPRMLPDGLGARIDLDAWTRQPIFDVIERLGNIDENEMLRTFNCGIGMVLAVDRDKADGILETLEGTDEKGFVIGEVIAREPGGPDVSFSR